MKKVVAVLRTKNVAEKAALLFPAVSWNAPAAMLRVTIRCLFGSDRLNVPL